MRVPPAHDARNWRQLWAWLGEDGQALDHPGLAQVKTPGGWDIARPGDWIVLTVSGHFHVAHSGRAGR